ncbi:hypothetical protein QM565_23645 [Geitlerinema splendidum]|nr:hypothetical protein [Geitlerinema splendidum]
MQYIEQKRLKVLPLCLTLCFLFAHNVFARKDASIVICAETGKIHHEHQADVVTHPASLTKMMTLYMTFKALKEKKTLFSSNSPRLSPCLKASPL